MRRSSWITILIVCLSMGELRDASAAESTTGWVLSHASARSVESGSGYRLFNVFNKTWLDVRRGNTIDVSKTPQDSVELVGRSGVIRCGDTFTIRVRGQTLTYDPVSTRVVIQPGAEPSDEWRFGSCKQGAIVMLDGKQAAIVNVRRRDAWVGCRRISGPPYCWDDRQLMGSATD